MSSNLYRMLFIALFPVGLKNEVGLPTVGGFRKTVFSAMLLRDFYMVMTLDIVTYYSVGVQVW